MYKMITISHLPKLRFKKIKYLINRSFRIQWMKSLVYWWPRNSEHVKLLLGICLFGGLLIQSVMYLSQPCNGSWVIWLLKCIYVSPYRNWRIKDVQAFVQSSLAVLLTRSYLIDRYLIRDIFLKTFFLIINTYGIINVSYFMFCFYEKQVTIWAREMKNYIRIFGPFDRAVYTIFWRLLGM
jgi:hypothetical protein